MPAVTVSVSRYAGPNSASMAARVAVKGAAETQGFEVRVEKASEFQDHQETTSRTITSQQVRDGTQETTPGEGARTWGQVSVVTWDDIQPARLAGLAYIIGDFTDILSSIFLRHVVEGEDLHVRAVNARTLQSPHTHT